MIEVKIICATPHECLALLSAIAALDRPTPETTGNVQAEQPAPTRRSRKKADPEPQAVPVVTVTDPTPTAVTAESLFGNTAAPTAAPERPKPTQAHLINAFRNLANAKGTDPIVALLGEFKAKSVALIGEADWGNAITKAASLAGITYEAAIVAPPEAGK